SKGDIYLLVLKGTWKFWVLGRWKLLLMKVMVSQTWKICRLQTDTSSRAKTPVKSEPRGRSLPRCGPLRPLGGPPRRPRVRASPRTPATSSLRSRRVAMVTRVRLPLSGRAWCTARIPPAGNVSPEARFRVPPPTPTPHPHPPPPPPTPTPPPPPHPHPPPPPPTPTPPPPPPTPTPPPPRPERRCSRGRKA
ncbi:uncharacterized protein LOC125962097, partial [Orcinus orca]|uniref:uncharacterized protein LOC125962097 n=1 Tax=Orcinus orca TaxID=9733 RepID=UPI002111176A